MFENEYLNSTIIFILAGFISTLIIYYLSPKMISYLAKNRDINEEKITNRFQIPLIITIILLTILFSVSESTYYSYVESWFSSAIVTLIVLFWMRGIINIGSLIIEKTVKKEKESHDIIPILDNIWIVFVILMVFVILLNIWEVNITPFLASAGVAGLIIGFAARDTIENFFGGLALYADQTYYTGDFIELDESTRGWVKEISIRSTLLHTLDGDSITIPNSKLHKSIIRNKSDPNSAFRTPIEIGISYNSDPEKVQNILQETIDELINEEDSIILSNPRPQIHLREFGDSSIRYEIFVWIRLPNQKPIIQNKINKKLYESLSEENVKIPYPQRTIHME